MINIKMQPTELNKLAPKIAVIGVGGAGGNAVNNMIISDLEGCEFVVCNTDGQALENSLCDDKVLLDHSEDGRSGLGAGGNPEVGKIAAESSLMDVLQYVDGANMVFITAGMGGGTGTGAAPVIAKACRERGILTVGVVTKPFHFEGTHRMKMAESGIEEMQGYVDTLIVVPNQNLFRVANENTGFAEAFCMADGVLQAGVRGVTDLMVQPGLVNLDFADIRTAMLEMGKAMMGTGEAEGEKRALEAAEAAINNPLLDDVSMKGARGVIINVTGGHDMSLFEVDEACNRIRDEVDPNANIIFGATFNDNMEGKMRVSIVATGIERESARAGAPISNDSHGFQRAQPRNAEPEQKPQTLQVAAAQLQIQSEPEAAAAPAEPDGELFEQTRLESESSAASPNPTAGATTPRGTRYQDSFIPPKPVEIRKEDLPAAAAPYAATQQAPAAPLNATQTQMAPRTPQNTSMAAPAAPIARTDATKKQTPSLFERITGGVFHGEEGHAAAGIPATDGPKPAPTTQGSLNIDSPAASPKGRDDELDIPAFLRRQAN